MDNIDVRNQIIFVCKNLYGRQMVSGSGGNISCRYRDRIIITPTGRSLGFLKSEDLVEVDMSGNVLSSGTPSKEVHLHLACYGEREDINAVVHVHPAYSIAFSCLPAAENAAGMPVYTPGYALRVRSLKMIDYYTPGSSSLAREIGSQAGPGVAFIMKNHGSLATGKSLEEALNIVEEMEENARVHFLVGVSGSSLTDGQLAELRSKKK